MKEPMLDYNLDTSSVSVVFLLNSPSEIDYQNARFPMAIRSVDDGGFRYSSDHFSIKSRPEIDKLHFAIREIFYDAKSYNILSLNPYPDSYTIDDIRESLDFEDIEEVIENYRINQKNKCKQAKVVITIGTEVLKEFTDKVLPFYHITYLDKQYFISLPDFPDINEELLRKALSKIPQIVTGSFKSVDYELKDSAVARTFEEFKSWADSHTLSEVAYDIETNAASPYSAYFEIIGFSLAVKLDSPSDIFEINAQNINITVSSDLPKFSINLKKSAIYVNLKSLDYEMSKEDIEKSLNLLKEILMKASNVTVHNCLYELPATLYQLRYDIPADKLTDTLVMAKLKFGGKRLGAGLKQNAQSIGYEDWETDLLTYVTNFQESISLLPKEFKTMDDLLNYADPDRVNVQQKPMQLSLFVLESQPDVISKVPVRKRKKSQETLSTCLNNLLKVVSFYYSEEELPDLQQLIVDKLAYAQVHGLLGNVIPYSWIPSRMLERYGAVDALATCDLKYYFSHLLQSETDTVNLMSGYQNLLKEHYTAYKLMISGLHWDAYSADEDRRIYNDMALKSLKYLLKNKTLQKSIIVNSFQELFPRAIFNNFNGFFESERNCRLVEVDGVFKIQDVNTAKFKSIKNLEQIFFDLKEGETFLDYIFEDKYKIVLDCLYAELNAQIDSATSVDTLKMFFNPQSVKSKEMSSDVLFSDDNVIFALWLKYTKSELVDEYHKNKTWDKFNEYKEKVKFKYYTDEFLQQVESLKTLADDPLHIALFEAYKEMPMQVDNYEDWIDSFKWLVNLRIFKKSVKMIGSYLDGKIGKESVKYVDSKQLSAGEYPRRYDAPDIYNTETISQTNFIVAQTFTGRWQCISGDTEIFVADCDVELQSFLSKYQRRLEATRLKLLQEKENKEKQALSDKEAFITLDRKRKELALQCSEEPVQVSEETKNLIQLLSLCFANVENNLKFPVIATESTLTDIPTNTISDSIQVSNQEYEISYRDEEPVSGNTPDIFYQRALDTNVFDTLTEDQLKQFSDLYDVNTNTENIVKYDSLFNFQKNSYFKSSSALERKLAAVRDNLTGRYLNIKDWLKVLYDIILAEKSTFEVEQAKLNYITLRDHEFSGDEVLWYAVREMYIIFVSRYCTHSVREGKTVNVVKKKYEVSAYFNYMKRIALYMDNLIILADTDYFDYTIVSQFYVILYKFLYDTVNPDTNPDNTFRKLLNNIKSYLLKYSDDFKRIRKKKEGTNVLTGFSKVPVHDLLHRYFTVIAYDSVEHKEVTASAYAVISGRDVPLIKLHLSNGNSLVCTVEHLLMLYDGRYIRASDSLEKLLKVSSFSDEAYVKVIFIEYLNEFAEFVYDLIVPVYNNFLLANGIFVHNSGFHTLPANSTMKNLFNSRFYGGVILQPDFSQNEIRCAASYANERKMLRSFQEGKDVHQANAAAMYHVPYDQVTKEQRRIAKGFSFSILYGSSAKSIADTYFNGDLEEAEQQLRNFYDTFKKLKAWMRRKRIEVQTNAKDVIIDGKPMKLGYVSTFTDRLIEILWEDGDRRSESSRDRTAVNYVIQSFSADTEIVNSLDSKSYKIADLVNRSEPFFVYSYDSVYCRVILTRGLYAQCTGYTDIWYKIGLSNSTCVKVTPEHLFYTSLGKSVPASELKVGDALLTFQVVLQLTVKSVTVVSIDIEQVNNEPKYDLYVPVYNNFLLANNIFVHNSAASTVAALTFHDIITHQERLNLKTKPVCFIHDSLESDVYPYELLQVIEYQQKALHEFAMREFKLALKADISMGVTLGEECELKSFEILDDEKTKARLKLKGYKNEIERLLTVWKSVYHKVDILYQVDKDSEFVSLDRFFMPKTAFNPYIWTTRVSEEIEVYIQYYNDKGKIEPVLTEKPNLKSVWADFKFLKFIGV